MLNYFRKAIIRTQTKKLCENFLIRRGGFNARHNASNEYLGRLVAFVCIEVLRDLKPVIREQFPDYGIDQNFDEKEAAALGTIGLVILSKLCDSLDVDPKGPMIAMYSFILRSYMQITHASSIEEVMVDIAQLTEAASDIAMFFAASDLNVMSYQLVFILNPDSLAQEKGLITLSQYAKFIIRQLEVA